MRSNILKFSLIALSFLPSTIIAEESFNEHVYKYYTNSFKKLDKIQECKEENQK